MYGLHGKRESAIGLILVDLNVIIPYEIFCTPHYSAFKSTLTNRLSPIVLRSC
jgi:hypothetical protein